MIPTSREPNAIPYLRETGRTEGIHGGGSFEK
jgi:hypothetical protein